MSLRVLLISILLVAGAVSGASAADGLYMGHPVYGYSGYSQGGGLYLNVFPYFAGVSLDGRPIGVANDHPGLGGGRARRHSRGDRHRARLPAGHRPRARGAGLDDAGAPDADPRPVGASRRLRRRRSRN